MSRPKDIGTAAETAIVRTARNHGFPNADRLTLTGALDRGDIGLCPGVIVEVKGGDAARHAADGTINAWLDETEKERLNARADLAFLALQRPRVGAVNAGRWWAWWRLGWLPGTSGLAHPTVAAAPVRMTIAAALTLIRDAGYGEPLTSHIDLEVAR